MVGAEGQPDRAAIEEDAQKMAAVAGLGVPGAGAVLPAALTQPLVQVAAHQRRKARRTELLVQLAASALGFQAVGGHPGFCETGQNSRQGNSRPLGESLFPLWEGP